jgi:hypothetical protein
MIYLIGKIAINRLVNSNKRVNIFIFASFFLVQHHMSFLEKFKGKTTVLKRD